MVKCKICGKEFKVITNTHLLSAHNIKIEDYIKRYGTHGCGFSLHPNLLPKSDPRYKRWKRSLAKRSAPWSKGYTKETNPSVAKISKTFKKKKIDNFKEWRKKAEKQGLFKSNYPPLKKDGNSAELIGVILGDGHIGKFPRTENLSIFSNSNNPGFIKRYATLTERIFNKKPKLSKHGGNCIKISFYQKDISKRLDIPIGARKNLDFPIPRWIFNHRQYLKRYLRGLYEAEGSFCIHKPTYTYKFMFSNRNISLLDNVYKSMKMLGFHPHRSRYLVQISSKKEVYEAKRLLKFRDY